MNKKELIKKYKYSGVPEMIPLSLKHGIKKVIKPNATTENTVLRNAKWVGKMSDKYASMVKRPGRREVVSNNISSSRAYAYMSIKKDMFLESISKKKYYRFDDMMVILDPFNWAPLTAVAIFYTKEPLAVRYTVKGNNKKVDYTATTKAEQYHRVGILGLYPNKKNKVVMELLNSNGESIKKRTIEIKTQPLSSDLENVVQRKQYKEESAFPMVLITGGLNIRTCAFDTEGDIRYYLRRKTKAYGIFPLSNGRFLYYEKYVDVPSFSVSQACMMYEMDYLGRIYKTYMYEKGFHHCAREKVPGGNFLMGSSDLITNGENMVVEMDRQTGEIVNSLNVNDIFDQTYQDWTDWAHVNAVSYYPEDDSVIISMRNIHTVAKVNWTTKEIKWLLSNPKMWEKTATENKVLKPIGDVIWNYQQHSAYKLDYDFDGNADTIHMIVYDNHWAKRRPVEWYDGDVEHSYLSIFTINEKDMTVSMEHATQCPNSRIRSISHLDTEKGRIFNMGGDLIPDIDGAKGIVEEYDFKTNELLNQFLIKPGYFTAYPFLPDQDGISETIEVDLDYFVGSTVPIEEFDGNIDFSNAKPLLSHKLSAEEEEVSSDDGQDETILDDGEEAKDKILVENVEKEVYTHFQEDILFVKAKDHTVSHIYLMGEEHSFTMDMSNTYQTMEIFEKTVYETPFWLKDMPEDTYHIYYQYKGELYDSEEEFTIKDMY